VAKSQREVSNESFDKAIEAFNGLVDKG